MTTAVRDTSIHLLVLHCALEEALTGLARQEAVVVSGHFVATHWTQFLEALLGIGQVGHGGGARGLRGLRVHVHGTHAWEREQTGCIDVG